MRLLALCSLLLAGCASVALGPSLVESKGLGYKSGYVGARAEGRAQHGSLYGVAQGAYYDAEKVGAGDGYGTRAGALGGVEVAPGFRILGGVTYYVQETSEWTKKGLAPTVQVEWQDGPKHLIGSVERLDDLDDSQWVGAVEARYGSHWPLFLRYEYIDYQTQFSEGTGHRWEAGLLIPIWRR